LNKVKNAYEKTIDCVNMSMGWSSWFWRQIGDKQGNILLLRLLNAIMNNICNKII
jgi:hypothetical protein